jgi:hypothetical protein
MKTSLYQDQSALIGHDIIEIWVRLPMTNKKMMKVYCRHKILQPKKKTGKKT